MPLQTLKQAVKEVIRQNELLGFHPEIFIYQTKRGEAPDLDYRIGIFVESQTAIGRVPYILDSISIARVDLLLPFWRLPV